MKIVWVSCLLSVCNSLSALYSCLNGYNDNKCESLKYFMGCVKVSNEMYEGWEGWQREVVLGWNGRHTFPYLSAKGILKKRRKNCLPHVNMSSMNGIVYLIWMSRPGNDYLGRNWSKTIVDMVTVVAQDPLQAMFTSSSSSRSRIITVGIHLWNWDNC